MKVTGVDIQMDGTHFETIETEAIYQRYDETYEQFLKRAEKKYIWKRSKKRNILIDNRVIKKLLAMFLISLSLFFSCTQPTIPSIPPAQSTIIGTWERQNQAFDFYANGEFKYYQFDTGMQYNYGFYLDYGDEIYIEDYISGVSVTYFYEIIDGGNTLSWYVSGGGVVLWGRVE